MAKRELKPAVKKEAKAAEPEETRGLPYFSPHVDIYETSEALTLVADMPGVESEKVDIDLKDNVLTLIGRTTFPLEKEMTPLYREYREGNYYRQFILSEIVDQERITAKMSHGVLTVTLPKVERAKPKKIQVTSE